MKTWHTKSGARIARVLAGRSCVYLLSQGGRDVLVDTSPASRWRTLDRKLKKAGVSRLAALVLTHAHYDHAGSAARLQAEYGAAVIVQRAEAAALARGESVLPDGTGRLTRFLVRRLRGWAPRLASPPCRADVLAGERLDLREYGIGAYALHTPGHSPGSQSVIVGGEIALVGDAMFGVFPWTAFPPFACDAGMLVESWGKLLDTGCRLFLPAHGTENSRALVEKDYNERTSKQPVKARA